MMMSEAWRDSYDAWKTTAPDEEELTGAERAELDALAEDAVIERAEREREGRMFDRDSQEGTP